MDSPLSMGTPFYSYYGNCLQTTPSLCGGTHELKATDKDKTFEVSDVQHLARTTKEACYWHIVPEGRTYWSSDSVIRITPLAISNATVHLYKGSSIYKANETVNDNQNLTVRESYDINVFEADAILVLLPVLDAANTHFSFNYKISGTILTEDQSIFDRFKNFDFATASTEDWILFVGFVLICLLILTAIIVLIAKCTCCRNKKGSAV